MIKETSPIAFKSVKDTFIPYMNERDSIGRMFDQTLVQNRMNCLSNDMNYLDSKLEPSTMTFKSSMMAENSKEFNNLH